MSKVEDRQVLVPPKDEHGIVPRGVALPSVGEARESLELDRIANRLIQVSSKLEDLKGKGASEEEIQKVEKFLEEGIDKLVRSTPSKSEEDITREKSLVRENLCKLVTEHKEETQVLVLLKALAEKNLSRVDLEKELSKIPDLNKEEGLKVIARFELENVASHYKGSLRIVANKIYRRDKEEKKEEKEEAPKLDLTLSLDSPVPRESSHDKKHRERLLRVHNERVELLLTKYESVLTKEGIDAVCKIGSQEGLVDLYLSKTKDLPREERRVELVRAGIFNSSNQVVAGEAIPVSLTSITPQEREFRENLYKKELSESTSRMLQVSYEIGFFNTPANKGDFESKTKCDQGRKERHELRERLDVLTKDMPEDFPKRDEVLEEVKQLNHKLGETELSGSLAFNKYKEGQEAQAKADYERRAEEGGAFFAANEIFSNAGDSLVHLREWTVLNTRGTYEVSMGLIQGQGYGRGASFVERQREYYNKNTRAGSIFGTDEEFSNMTNWELGLEVSAWGGASHIAGGVISPALELVDVGRVQAQRGSAFLGSSLVDQVTADSTRALTYSQYRTLEQTDGLLKTAKYSFQVAEISAGLAMGMPYQPKWPWGSLAKNLGISGGMGVGSAASTQLMGEESFNLGQFFEDTLANTAGSQLFSGTMQLGTSAWMKARAGGILTKLNKGEVLIPDEIAFLEKTVKQAQAVTKGIDFLDGHSDLKEAMINFKNVGDVTTLRGVRTLLGALVGAGVAGVDTVDVSLLAGRTKDVLKRLKDQKKESEAVSVIKLDEGSVASIGEISSTNVPALSGLELPEVTSEVREGTKSNIPQTSTMRKQQALSEEEFNTLSRETSDRAIGLRSLSEAIKTAYQIENLVQKVGVLTSIAKNIAITRGTEDAKLIFADVHQMILKQSDNFEERVKLFIELATEEIESGFKENAEANLKLARECVIKIEDEYDTRENLIARIDSLESRHHLGDSQDVTTKDKPAPYLELIYNGEFETAERLINNLENPLDRLSPLLILVRKQLNKKLSKDSLSSLQEIITIVDTLEQENERDKHYVFISSIAGIVGLIDVSYDVTGKILDEAKKLQMYIAAAGKEVSKEGELGFRNLEEAEALVGKVTKSPIEQSIAYIDLAKLRYRMGENDKAKAHFASAKASVGNEESIYRQRHMWCTMAKAEKEVGFVSDAIQSFGEAKLLASKFEWDWEINEGYNNIAIDEASVKLFSDAFETTGLIENGLYKDQALAGISQEYAKHQMFDKARTTANKIIDKTLKAVATEIIYSENAKQGKGFTQNDQLTQTLFSSNIPRLMRDTAYVHPIEAEKFIEDSRSRLRAIKKDNESALVARNILLIQLGMLERKLSESKKESETVKLRTELKRTLVALSKLDSPNALYLHGLGIETQSDDVIADLCLAKCRDIELSINKLINGKTSIDQKNIELDSLQNDLLRNLKPLLDIKNPKGLDFALRLVGKRKELNSLEVDAWLDDGRIRYLLNKLFDQEYLDPRLGKYLAEQIDSQKSEEEIYSVLAKIINNLGICPDLEVYKLLEAKGILVKETLEERVDELKTFTTDFVGKSKQELDAYLLGNEKRLVIYYALFGGKHRYNLINDYNSKKFELVLRKTEEVAISQDQLAKFAHAIEKGSVSKEETEQMIARLQQGKTPIEGNRIFEVNAVGEVGQLAKVAQERFALSVWGSELESIVISLVQGLSPTNLHDAKLISKDNLNSTQLAQYQKIYNKLKINGIVAYQNISSIADAIKKDFKAQGQELSGKLSHEETVVAYLKKELGEGVVNTGAVTEWLSHLTEVKETISKAKTEGAQGRDVNYEVTILDKGEDYLRAVRFADAQRCCFNSGNYQMLGDLGSADWIARINKDPLTFIIDIKEKGTNEISGFVFIRSGIDPASGKPVLMVNGIYSKDMRPGLVNGILEIIENNIAKPLGAHSIVLKSEHAGTLSFIPDGFEEVANVPIEAIRALEMEGAPEENVYDDIGTVANGEFEFEGLRKILRNSRADLDVSSEVPISP